MMSARRHLSDEEIVETAFIVDNIGKGFPEGLPAGLARVIARERLQGRHCVLLYWEESGLKAVVPCPPGSNMPTHAQTITAYRMLEAQHAMLGEGEGA